MDSKKVFGKGIFKNQPLAKFYAVDLYHTSLRGAAPFHVGRSFLLAKGGPAQKMNADVERQRPTVKKGWPTWHGRGRLADMERPPRAKNPTRSGAPPGGTRCAAAMLLRAKGSRALAFTAVPRWAVFLGPAGPPVRWNANPPKRLLMSPFLSINQSQTRS